MEVVEKEKLNYLTDEVTKFLIFTIALTNKRQSVLQLDRIGLSKKIADFYRNNESHYNKNQLVHQFIKKYLGIEMLKEYSKVKKYLYRVQI